MHIPEGAIHAMSFQGNGIAALIQRDAAASSNPEAPSVSLRAIGEDGIKLD